jgi:hypothetical protein
LRCPVKTHTTLEFDDSWTLNKSIGDNTKGATFVVAPFPVAIVTCLSTRGISLKSLSIGLTGRVLLISRCLPFLYPCGEPFAELPV